MIALGVSSPAYPARKEDDPMSTTSADTSSVQGGVMNVYEVYSRNMTYPHRSLPSFGWVASKTVKE
jgi:hypothetical protein